MEMCWRWLRLTRLANYLSFFAPVQMSLELCLIKHDGRWMRTGAASFLPIPASVCTAQHQRLPYCLTACYCNSISPVLCHPSVHGNCSATRTARPAAALRHLIIKSDAFGSAAVRLIGVAGRNGRP